MKKKTKSNRHSDEGDLRSEYRFDYRRSKPNRFASQFKPGSVVVVLDPDVASVFRTSESVNGLLRSVISAIPEGSSSATTGEIDSGSINALQRTDADEKEDVRRDRGR